LSHGSSSSATGPPGPEAGVDRALIHRVLWGTRIRNVAPPEALLGAASDRRDGNELAMEAVRKCPDRFRIMGYFIMAYENMATGYFIDQRPNSRSDLPDDF